jgi:hypothetical protein
VPPPEPVSAPAPSNAPEELPVPGPGWHFGGADRAANRPNWGNVPPPEPIINNGWGISPSPAPQDSSHGYSRRKDLTNKMEKNWRLGMRRNWNTAKKEKMIAKISITRDNMSLLHTYKIALSKSHF